LRPYFPGGPLNTFAPAATASEPPRPSGHRLGPGLPGYLIPFAPLAFASQRQDTPSELFSPSAFQTISTHFTAPPFVPLAPECLEVASLPGRSTVEPWDFTRTLNDPPTRALSPVIPPNARHLCITAAAGTELAVPSSGAPQNLVAPDRSLHPEGLNLHAASLRHPCGHCGRFVTAAPRRSLGSVSVPMWLAVLSDQLRVVALVGRYPHQLADTKSPAPKSVALWGHRDASASRYPVLPGLSAGYPGTRGTLAIHYSPVRHWTALLPPRTTCMS
jgi:hypothetical protein